MYSVIYSEFYCKLPPLGVRRNYNNTLVHFSKFISFGYSAFEFVEFIKNQPRDLGHIRIIAETTKLKKNSTFRRV